MINEVRSPRIDELFMLHAANRLSIATPPVTSDECTHPDVLDMYQESGTVWNGYRYWLTLTPLPEINPNDNENPCIYASNDLITWVDPGTNPITPAPPAGYNSDTDLYYDRKKDALYCFYRVSNAKAVYKKSTDGSTWSAEVITYTFLDVRDMTSPSVIRDRGMVKMYGVFTYDYGTPDVSSKIFYVERADIESGDWGSLVECSIDITGTLAAYIISAPNFYYIWHINVRKFLGVYYLYAYMRSDLVQGEGLYICTSRDGINFTASKYPLLVHYTNGQLKWDTGFYRSTLIPYIDEEINFYSLYAGWIAYMDIYPDYIGYSQILPTLPDHIKIGSPNSINGRRAEIFEIANAKSGGYVFADDYDRADDLTGLGTSSGGDAYDIDANLNIVDEYALATIANSYFSIDPGIVNVEISWDAILNGGRLDILPKLIDSNQLIRFDCSPTAWNIKYDDVNNNPPNGQIVSDSIRIYDRFKTDEINSFKIQIRNEYFKFYINGCMVIDYTFKDADFANAANRAQIMAATTIVVDFKSTAVRLKSFLVKELT